MGSTGLLLDVEVEDLKEIVLEAVACDEKARSRSPGRSRYRLRKMRALPGSISRRELRGASICMLALLLCLLALLVDRRENKVSDFDVGETNVGRHLLADITVHHNYDHLNCTPRAVGNFPSTIFTQQQRLRGAIILYILAAAYMFLALAIICDDYFVPSCEFICDALNLQDDVAGATFMAAGSSAPELATTVIGVFVTKDDIGLGAVVGSAVFNVMFVPGICALFAGMVIYLRWWPLVRDSLFYTISIVALVLIIMDGSITWWEAVILLSLYIVYIVLMIFNPKIEKWMEGKSPCCGSSKQPAEEEMLTATAHGNNTTNSGTFSEEESSDNTAAVKTPEEDKEDDESPLTFPSSWHKRILWVISLPLTILFLFSVPDCRKPAWKKWYILTFFMSIIWIGACSYLMVWMITVIGFDFKVPDTVMGITFIAAGSSVPDAIASLIVCREGLGDMAISNAIGSNVFDILLCLGLPWLLQTTIAQNGEPIHVFSGGLTYSALTLLSTVVLLVLITHVNKWRLTKPYGVILLIIYVLFNVLASLYELNVFGKVDPPQCDMVY